MTSPVQQSAPLSLGLRALDLARAELRRSVREEPPGSNTGPDVRRYLAGCVRHGRRLGLTAGAWCAALASWCVWQAWCDEAIDVRGGVVASSAILMWAPNYPEHIGPSPEPEPPIGYRAAVWEIVADARATNALRLPQAAEHPLPGDLLIYGRDGATPLTGGAGHITFCAAWSDGDKRSIGGNEQDALAEVELGADGEHPRCGPLLAWVRLD